MVTPVAPPVSIDLAFLLSQASYALTTELTAALAGLGVTPREHCVLSKALAGDLTQNRLAELCALDKTTMVVTIDELERAGLAERRVSASDRRARIIEVTEAGRAKVAAGQAIVDRIQAEILGSLPQAQRDAFVHALTQLVDGRLSTPVECEQTVRRRVPRG